MAPTPFSWNCQTRGALSIQNSGACPHLTPQPTSQTLIWWHSLLSQPRSAQEDLGYAVPAVLGLRATSAKSHEWFFLFWEHFRKWTKTYFNSYPGFSPRCSFCTAELGPAFLPPNMALAILSSLGHSLSYIAWCAVPGDTCTFTTQYLILSSLPVLQTPNKLLF